MHTRFDTLGEKKRKGNWTTCILLFNMKSKQSIQIEEQNIDLKADGRKILTTKTINFIERMSSKW